MRLLYVVAKAEYFLSHRLALAKAAQDSGFDVAVATTRFEKNNIKKILGIRSFLVEFKRGSLSIFNELKTFYSLYKRFDEFKPTLVHNVALKPSLYGAAIARVKGVPSINSINGFGYIFTSTHLKARLLRPIVEMAIKLILNNSTICVIVQNNDDYQLCKKILPQSKVFLVKGSGVELDVFYPVNRDGVKIFTFTLVSRMLWTKGVGEFVEAARRFRDIYPKQKVRFLLVGAPDPENPETISEAVLKEWSQQGVVEWLGHMDDVQRVYAETNVAVLPSYREGLPKSLLEAMACGLPIITTDAIGCCEIVRKENGIKIPVKSVEGLISAFDYCIKNKNVCELMGNKGKEFVEKFYSVDIINSKIIDIYNQNLK